MADVTMPRLSDSMEEGTILKWLKSDGDEVSKGEELVEIETDKANMTYEADSDGVLEIVAQEGDTLPVGEPIARLGSGSGGGSSDEGGEESGAEAKSEDEDTEDQEAKGEEDEDADAEGDADADAEAEAESDDEAKAEEDEDAEGEGDADADAKAEDEEATAEDDEAKGEGDDDEEPEAEGEGDEAEAEGEGDDAQARDGGDSGNGHRESKPEPAPASAGGGDGDGDGNGRVKASPVARRMAREMGVELATLEGTGPGGRIVKADVEAAARGDGAPTEAPEKGKAEPAEAEEKPAEEKAEKTEERKEDKKAPPAVVSGEQGRGDTETVELTRLQRTVARRMAESKATAPDFVITLEVDMDEAVEFRKQLKAAAGDSPAPSFNDFVIKASALALRDFPRANGAYKDGKFELYSRVNVGVAVAGMDALVVPTVFDADHKSLGQIARESRALAERVRAAKITPPELSGGTFTVSNLGMYGIKRFVAVINPPQAAILAVGELTPRPVVRDGEIVSRHILELTLSCDHRILYGSDAAEFLARIREYLELPLRLAL
jgi:pyruvate dehydrogenase E2 component (dihydrolipoyllysine-residue acetyltransferase)